MIFEDEGSQEKVIGGSRKREEKKVKQESDLKWRLISVSNLVQQGRSGAQTTSVLALLSLVGCGLPGEGDRLGNLVGMLIKPTIKG